MIIKEINQNILRDLLDDAGVSSKKDSDGDLMTILAGDDDFPHDVVIWFMVEDNWLTIIARSFDFKVDSPVEVANEYNRSHRALTCIGEEDGIFFKAAYLLDEEVSTQYIIENCIRFGIGTSWRSFCDLYKQAN